MKTRISLALVAMFVTLALVGPAAAQQGVPFHGTIQERETDVITFPTLSVDGSGTGIATLLGRFTVNLVDGSGSGSFHFIAANGDSIFTEDHGQAEPTDTPGVLRIFAGFARALFAGAFVVTRGNTTPGGEATSCFKAPHVDTPLGDQKFALRWSTPGIVSSTVMAR